MGGARSRLVTLGTTLTFPARGWVTSARVCLLSWSLCLTLSIHRRLRWEDSSEQLSQLISLPKRCSLKLCIFRILWFTAFSKNSRKWALVWGQICIPLLHLIWLKAFALPLQWLFPPLPIVSQSQPQPLTLMRWEGIVESFLTLATEAEITALGSRQLCPCFPCHRLGTSCMPPACPLLISMGCI